MNGSFGFGAFTVWCSPFCFSLFTVFHSTTLFHHTIILSAELLRRSPIAWAIYWIAFLHISNRLLQLTMTTFCVDQWIEHGLLEMFHYFVVLTILMLHSKYHVAAPALFTHKHSSMIKKPVDLNVCGCAHFFCLASHFLGEYPWGNPFFWFFWTTTLIRLIFFYTEELGNEHRMNIHEFERKK